MPETPKPPRAALFPLPKGSQENPTRGEKVCHIRVDSVSAACERNVVVGLYGVHGVSKAGKAAKPSGARNARHDKESRSLSGNRTQTGIRGGGINCLERLAYLSLGPIEAEPGNIYDGSTEYMSLRHADHLSPGEDLIDYIVKRIGHLLRIGVKDVS